MNTTKSLLTEAQQGVLRAYDKDIAHFNNERAFAEKLGDSTEVNYYTLKIENLRQERLDVENRFYNAL